MNPLGWCPMFITRFTPKVPDRTPASSLQPVYPVRFSILGGVLYLSTLLPLLIINRELHQHTLGSTKPLSRDLKNPNCKWHLLYLLVGKVVVIFATSRKNIISSPKLTKYMYSVQYQVLYTIQLPIWANVYSPLERNLELLQTACTYCT